MGEGDRDRHVEDPFEDLERFFEPIQQVRWPEEPEAPGDRPAGTDADDLVAVIPEAEEPAAEADGPAPDRGAPEVVPDPRPTAELSVDEWRRLRDVLGDEDDEVQFEFPSNPAIVESNEAVYDIDRDLVAAGPAAMASGSASGPGVGGGGGGSGGDARPPEPPRRERPVEPGEAGESRSSGERQGAPDRGVDPHEESGVPDGDDFSTAWPDRGDDRDEPGELTLDDLKKAPPEYRDLPGPRREHPVPPGSTPRAPVQRPGSAAVGPGEPHVQVIGGQPEPSLAEVEAMADRLAREFRDDEAEASPGTPATDDDPAAVSTGVAGPVFDPFDDDLADFEPPEPAPPPSPPARRTVKVGEPEDLTGPAWEDPMGRTVMREPPPPSRGGERNLPIAVLTAAGLIVAALVSIWIRPVVFAVVAGVVILIAQAELYAAQHRRELHPAAVLGLVAGAMVVAGGYFRQEGGLIAMLVVATGGIFLWYMATPLRIRVHVMSGAAATLFGVLYVPFLASFAVVILSSTTSRALVLWILGLTFLYDVSAFFIGRYWGRRPLAHTISPKKSWEGLIGATFVTLLASALMGPLPMGPITSIGRAMGLGGIVVVFAPLGDLAESLLKRDLGLKDMGSILPGHGGMLDRIDSLLFVLPAAYFFLRVVG